MDTLAEVLWVGLYFVGFMLMFILLVVVLFAVAATLGGLIGVQING